MATNTQVRRELRECLELKIALIEDYRNITHLKVVRKIKQLLAEHDFLTIATLQKALDHLREVYRDNIKYGKIKVCEENSRA